MSYRDLLEQDRIYEGLEAPTYSMRQIIKDQNDPNRSERSKRTMEVIRELGEKAYLEHGPMFGGIWSE